MEITTKTPVLKALIFATSLIFVLTLVVAAQRSGAELSNAMVNTDDTSQINLNLGFALTPTLTDTPRPTNTPTATPVITDTEVIVLQQAAQAVGCPPDVIVIDTTYSFYCTVSIGHTTDAEIMRYNSAAEAEVAFDAARGSNPLKCFHGYPAYTWEYDQNPGHWLPMKHRGHAWQAVRWVITAHSFDDTHFIIAPAPATVSEAIYQSKPV